jgi:hypothetical protein
MTIRKAYIIVVLLLTVSLIGSFVSGLFSAVNEMPSKTYCFYTYSSPATVYWFGPLVTIALIIITLFFVMIFVTARRSENGVMHLRNLSAGKIQTNQKFHEGTTNKKRIVSQKVAVRITKYITLFFLSWTPATAMTFYYVAVGTPPYYFDIIVAFTIALNSTLMSATYGWHFIAKKNKVKPYSDNGIVVVIAGPKSDLSHISQVENVTIRSG